MDLRNLLLQEGYITRFDFPESFYAKTRSQAEVSTTENMKKLPYYYDTQYYRGKKSIDVDMLGFLASELVCYLLGKNSIDYEQGTPFITGKPKLQPDINYRGIGIDTKGNWIEDKVLRINGEAYDKYQQKKVTEYWFIRVPYEYTKHGCKAELYRYKHETIRKLFSYENLGYTMGYCLYLPDVLHVSSIDEWLI